MLDYLYRVLTSNYFIQSYVELENLRKPPKDHYIGSWLYTIIVNLHSTLDHIGSNT